jgi:hypothetical protein
MKETVLLFIFVVFMGLTLVILPQDNILQELNQLKNYYYQN